VGNTGINSESMQNHLMNNKSIRPTAIVLLIFLLGSCKVRSQDSFETEQAKNIKQHSDSLILSPDKKMALSIIRRNGQPELWVTRVNGAGKRKLSNLTNEEGAMSPAWSPDGALIAFVSYNLAGHSPMTTTHVWVIRLDGRGLRKVILPKPNERFSTFDPRWRTSTTLLVKALTLVDSSEQKYLYNYKTGKIKKVDWEQKEEKR
jgi:Tol biopolymer transport system component